MDRRTFLLATLASVPALGDVRPSLLVGDSLAYMLAPPLRRRAKARGVGLPSDGRGGTNTAQWARNGWLPGAMSKARPSQVLVSLGVNDWGVRPNRDSFAAHAKRVVERIHERGAEAVWLLPPKIEIPTGFIRDGAAGSGADRVHDPSGLEIPLFKEPRNARGKRPPSVHPTFKGLEVWADDLARFLWG